VVSGGRRVVGYYALAMSSVEHDGAPSRLRPGMPDPVPVVLLARLAVEQVEQDTISAGTCSSMLLASILGRGCSDSRVEV
jgi:hypothetical protein